MTFFFQFFTFSKHVAHSCGTVGYFWLTPVQPCTTKTRRWDVLWCTTIIIM